MYSQLTYTCDGLEVRLHQCAAAGHLKLELLTPEDRYEYGDYPEAEAHELACRLIENRRAWSPPDNGGYWYPAVWQVREWRPGKLEFWRRGPGGLELSVHQPHGTYWRMYWAMSPVVRTHHDRGIFDFPWEAMGALDVLAEGGMKGALLD